MNDTPSHGTTVTPPKDTPLRPAGLLVCHRCKKQTECEASSLLAFTREGWPKCCEEVMTLYTPADKAISDDTKIG
jgi:hypothetical protein